jgi:murein DD-endopeptidase MepM/ murein hydrolase activator NlpD
MRREQPSPVIDQAVDRVFAFFGKARRASEPALKKAGVFFAYCLGGLAVCGRGLARAAALAKAWALRAAGAAARGAGWLMGSASHIAGGLLARLRAAAESGSPAALWAIAAFSGIAGLCGLAGRKARAAYMWSKAALKAAALATGRTAACAALAAAKGLKAAGGALARCWDAVCAFFERHKRATAAALCTVFALALCAVGVINHYSAYEYMYNGKPLGFVKDKDIVYSTVGLVGDKLSEAYEAQIKIDPQKDISFRRVYVSGEKMDGHEDVLHHLTYMKDMKVTGYAIVADGEKLAVLDSAETAEALLGTVKDQYTEGADGVEREYKSIGFAENVQIKEVDTKLANLEDPDTVLDYILTGAVEQQVHVVVKGETLSDIAKANGLKTAELMQLNPEIVPERMQIGAEVKLERIVPLVTVETVEVASYLEPVPYGIVYEDTSAMYQGEQTVKLAGTNGERRVTAEITKQNGFETGKKELESMTLAEPSSQVVLVGTKAVPPLIGLGYFEYPTRGRLSSRFGMRWGRHHNGIDLASPSGTAIRAADGGKVVFSGWNGALGYTVIIDHGANRETLYGHCSKLLVSKGDKVYQGQHIANVGNTGNSTGPHLHFEVHINGTPKNPLNYL